MSTGASDWLGLAGKTAVVTGSASGIGKAIALSLAEVGCSVALLDKDAKAVEAAAAELVAKGHKAVGFACDTSDKAGVEDIAFQVTKALGDVTVVVNNAGILRPGPLDTIGIDQWNAVLSVNLTGYLIVSQAFLPGMKAKGGGAIVHIASIAGSNAQQNSGAYSPAKAGVVMLSRTMAAEFGKFGVRSNVVSPGLIR
jgi:NAD(P)-dependent dehydrogenase (short-subunit alcohol dehydrogenase family)